MFGVNGWEFVLLILIAVFVLGPDKLPEYAAKLARGVRQLRVFAEGAKEQLKDQLGPDYEDIDWRQYDPRQYDPRRIVREALLEPIDDAVAPVRDEVAQVRTAAGLNGNTPRSDVTGGGSAVGAAAAATAAVAGSGGAAAPPNPPQEYDPGRPTPFDVDAT